MDQKTNSSITKERLKAVWLTSSYPRYDGDSASIFLRHLASAIQQEDIEVHVLAPDHVDVPKDPSLRDSGITLHHFRYFMPRNRQKLAYGFGILPNLRTNSWLYFQIPFFLAAMFFSTWRLLRTVKPQLIHAHWLFPQGTISVLLGKLLDIPVVITTHGGDVFALQGSLLGRIKRWSIRNCSAWTSNTNKTAGAVGPGLPSAHVIPMGIGFEQFHLNHVHPNPLKKEPGCFILLFVGRLAEKKGVGDLIEAFSLLPEDMKNRTALWIVGDGEKRDVLERQANDLGVSRRVKFWGCIPNDQLPPYYGTADIFIAPSIIDSSGDTEGQGVVLLEALASNTSIISTRVGGIEEVIRHGETGILTEPSQPEQLKDAIIQLLENKKIREKLSLNGVKHAQEYEWKVIGQKFVSLYRSAVSEN